MAETHAQNFRNQNGGRRRPAAIVIWTFHGSHCAMTGCIKSWSAEHPLESSHVLLASLLLYSPLVWPCQCSAPSAQSSVLATRCICWSSALLGISKSSMGYPSRQSHILLRSATQWKSPLWQSRDVAQLQCVEWRKGCWSGLDWYILEFERFFHLPLICQ